MAKKTKVPNKVKVRNSVVNMALPTLMSPLFKEPNANDDDGAHDGGDEDEDEDGEYGHCSWYRRHSLLTQQKSWQGNNSESRSEYTCIENENRHPDGWRFLSYFICVRASPYLQEFKLLFVQGAYRVRPIGDKHLNDIIELYKTNNQASRAAANVITILVRVDLRGVQIPGADLPGGQFDSMQLQGANLSGANLTRSWVQQIDLSGACV